MKAQHHSTCSCCNTQSNVSAEVNKMIEYFEINSVIGVSLSSEDSEFDVCDATNEHSDCWECHLLDKDGHEWNAHLSARALDYWFNAEI
jgi:hypothetical protein